MGTHVLQNMTMPSGASGAAEYVVLALTGSLSAERVLTAGTGIAVTKTSSTVVTLTTDDSAIDHTAIANIGTNTHAQIDTHLALTSEHIDWTADQGATNIHSGNLPAVAITSGTWDTAGSIDSVAIGDSTPAAGAFTTLDASGAITSTDSIDLSTTGQPIFSFLRTFSINLNGVIGKIQFGVVDPDVTNIDAVTIIARADGLWTGASDTPARLEFSTVPDESSTTTLAMTIESDQSVTAEVDLLVRGRFSSGEAAIGYAMNVLGGSYTSDGSANSAVGTLFRYDITAVDGDTNWHTLIATGAAVGASITTQDNSETVGVIASLYLSEPSITKGSDTVTIASTLYIPTAPTEGETNYAIYVENGDVHLADDLTVGTDLSVNGDVVGDLDWNASAIDLQCSGVSTNIYLSIANSLGEVVRIGQRGTAVNPVAGTDLDGGDILIASQTGGVATGAGQYGADIELRAGAASAGAAGNNAGGNGGSVILTGSIGGDGTGSGLGGQGGTVVFTAGNGGSTVSGTNGTGGDIVLRPGAVGTGGSGGFAGNVMVYGNVISNNSGNLTSANGVASFSGSITNLTVVNGIVTAAS